MTGSTTNESLYGPPDNDILTWAKASMPDIAEEYCKLARIKASNKGISLKQAATVNYFELAAGLICNFLAERQAPVYGTVRPEIPAMMPALSASGLNLKLWQNAGVLLRDYDWRGNVQLLDELRQERKPELTDADGPLCQVKPRT